MSVADTSRPLLMKSTSENEVKSADRGSQCSHPSRSSIFKSSHLGNLISQSITCREGLVWITLAILLQAGQILLVSSVTHTLGTMEALFIRSFFLLSTMFFISWGKSESYGFVEMVVFSLTGLCDSLYILFAALAANYISVGDLSTFTFNQPLPSMTIACIIFNEKMDVTDVILTLLNGCGLVLVSQPSFLFPQQEDTSEFGATNDKAKGLILAVGSLSVSVISTLACRSSAYRKKEDAFLFGTMTGLIGIMLTCLGVSMTSSALTYPHGSWDWFVTFALGLCATGAVCCYIKALEKEHVLTITVFMTLTIPLNNMFDFIILKRNMNWFEVGGIVLILSSTFSLFFKSKFTTSESSN